MEKTDLKKLLDRYLDGSIGSSEIDRLFDTLQEEEHKDQWHRSIEEILKDRSLQGLSDPPRMKQLMEAILPDREERGGRLVMIPGRLSLRRLGKYAAAIAVVSLSAGLLWTFRHPTVRPVVTRAAVQRFRNDLPAGGNKAILVLANGSRVILDSVADGAVARQGSMRIVKLANGQLAYHPTNKAAATTLYNTVSTPRGGQYELLLADGTRVWLNAASSLRFPISFEGNDRTVDLEGEAYFEVARNEQSPFRVNVDGTPIEVLGTHFEVNAYHDEGVLKATLLEGRIRVGRTGAEAGVILEPGQQAQVSAAGSIGIFNSPDIADVMAWKNGLFQFRATDIYSIMRQVARWYDVDVNYEGDKIKQTFYGSIPRSVTAINLFKVLEETGAVHFNIDGRKVTVSP